MSIYNVVGEQLNNVYDINADELDYAYDINGDVVYSKEAPLPDYTSYSYTQKWGSKGISNAQGFDIYDNKVFWIAKSGDGSVPSNCYVWNLSDGSQALGTAYITVYCGHGNNLCFDFPTLYGTSAYTPKVYVNSMTDSFVATLTKTLYANDGCVDCDACIDENDANIMWTLGHTGYGNSDPYLISKWDITDLTDNGDGTYSPRNISTISITPPSNRYFQGLKHHDGLLWYGNGNGGVASYIRAVDPTTGTEEYVINLNTTTEVEGVSWVQESGVVGGYAMYVGLQGMILRRYTFGQL